MVTLPDRYDDGGFTGGNLERPLLKRLLNDIEAGKIQSVVATTSAASAAPRWTSPA